MQLDVTLQARHATALRELLQRPDGIEAAAYVMFGRNIVGIDPWSRRRRLRLISHQVVPVPAGDEISASARHVTWSTASFVSLCRQAAERGLVPAIVHSHPAGCCGPGAPVRSLIQVMDRRKRRVSADPCTAAPARVAP